MMNFDLAMRRVRFLLGTSAAALLLTWGLASTARAQSTATNVVSGVISVPGQRDVYAFNVAATTRFYFDALTNASALQWSLSGPPGAVVANRSFTGSDAQSVNDPTVLLPAGNYTLTIQSSNGTTNGYAFRFVNLADATLLTPGTVVSNALAPANRTDLYQFTAAAGDRYYFHQIARTSLPNTWWRLMDPYGNQIFSQNFTDVGTPAAPVALPAAGVYTLMIEGYISDPGSGGYAFNAVPEGNVPPPPFTGTPMNLGDLIAGNLAANTTNAYTFTLASAARIIFDSQTNSPSLNWTLQGPSGVVVNRSGLNNSGGINGFGPLVLPAGGYQLNVQGNASSPYQFRLLDLAGATPLTPGTPVTNTLSPASADTIYRFTASAGARFYFDNLAVNNLPYAYWRLVDPYDTIVFASYVGYAGSSQGPLTLNNAGTYTLLVEGYYADSGSGTNTFNVVPVTDGLQALTLGSVVTGAVSSPGQRQQYTFTLAAAAQLYFDSLTNNYNLRWSLDGPAGNVVNSRSFTSSDSQNVGNPVLALPAGSYTLTVTANADGTGGYQFRLFDLATAAPLTPGTVVNGTLNPANATVAYQFALAAPGKVYYDYLSSSGLPDTYVRLVDAYGNVPIATYLGLGVGPVALLAGTYTLLVEGYIYNPGSGSYSFNLAPVTDGSQSLALGNVTAGAVSSPGQRQQYTFTLATAARLYFDSLTNNYNLRWSLDGPEGNVVNSRSFTGSDAQNVGNPVLALPAGSYTVTVFASGDNVGGYQFRLFDLATAAPLTPGTVVNGTLNPANSTVAYQFTLAAPAKFYYDYLSFSGLPNAFVRLVDAYGNIPIATSLSSGVGPVALPAGAYTLLVEGYISDPGSGSYSFNLAPITDGLQALTVGSPVVGAVSSPGQRQQYTFTLATATRLYFDSLTNNYNLRWSLDGPAGNVVNSRSFTGSDAQSVGNPVLALPAGSYTLTVSASADATGGYQFRLLDFAAATALTPGTPVTVNNFPANSTDLYRFNAAAGDRFSFLYQSSSGIPSAYWRLVDPYNNIIFAQYLTSSAGTNTLTAAGTYTLLIEGYIGNSGLGSYSFNVVPGGNVPPTPFTGTPLTVGSVVTGSLAMNNATAAYTFTLPAAATLYFDALTNTYFTWSLAGPAGVVVNNRSFLGSDGADSSDPSLPLPAGNYQLTLTGPAGDFQFRLLDFATAAPLTPGVVVSNTLSPANSTVFYQFTGTAGQPLYFDGLPSSGFSYQPYCRLYGPNGNIVLSTYVTGNVDTFALPQSGTYTLTVEGRVYDPHASGTYAFNLLPVAYATNTLNIGDTIAGTISTLGQRQFYTFTLPVAATLYFDALTNADFWWRLDAPWGSLVNWRSFTSSDSADISDPRLPLPAGTYTLTVAGDSFAVTGGYQFRLLNFTNTTVFTPGVVVSNTLSPADSTVFYQFTGTAGQQLYFDGRPTTGFIYQPYCRLYGPAGNVLLTTYSTSDVDTFSLPQSGTYTLTVEGRVYDNNASGTYAFNLLPVTYPTNALTIGAVTTGTIATLGQRQFYTFTLPAAATLYFDALTNADLWWRLDAPWGNIVNWRPFSNSDGADISDPSLPLPAGTYTLALAGDNFRVTGGYQFRLLNFADATAFTPGTVVSNTLSPADSTVFYQFAGTAGDRYYFDGQLASGFTYTPLCRLYAPAGNILLSQSVNQNVDTFALPQSGTYTLTVEGRIYDTHASGNYAFTLVPNPPQPPLPLFPTNVLPDLVVASVSVSPPSGIQSGGLATVQWTDQNSGTGPTSGSFTDRVTIRNAANQVLVDSFLPYTESDPGNGPLAPGTTRNRQLAVRLPDGTNSVGTLQVTVSVDAQNAIAESNEANNSTSASFTVTLAPYPDLLVASVGTVPPTRWLPGSVVTVDWQLTNSGAGLANTNWTDSVVVVNTNTSAVLFSGTTNYNLADPGNGPIAPGDFRNRALAFTMPTDANAYGVFAVTVTADSANQVFEYNPNGTAKLNNSTTITVLSAPDLTPAGLAVSSTGPLQSGGTLTISWNDQNTGTVDTGGSFYDRVTVVNTNTGETLLNATVFYNPATPGNGPIPPGGARPRSTTLLLPDGPRGVGTLLVSVALDTFNNIPEFNAGGTAEANNSATTTAVSTIANYPDLQVVNLDVQPPVLNSGTNLTVRWQDTNSGNAAVLGNWFDRVTIVNTNLGVTLLDTTVYYDTNTLGPLTNGTARGRSVNFTLPNGATGSGTLVVTVTADTFNNVFEYNPAGTGESNNTATVTAISGIAAYPDLQIVNLTVQPPVLSSGTSLTVQWQDTNSGNATVSGNWYDHLTISNASLGVTLLDTTVLYNAGILGPLTNGTARARSYGFTLPYTSNGAGGLVFTVTADIYNNVFEYNPAGTGENNNTTSIALASTLTPLPDLVVTSLTSTNQAFTSQTISARLEVANQGLLGVNTDLVQRVFLSTTPTPGTGTLVAQADYNGPLAVGQFVDETVSVLMPSVPGTYWLIAQADAANNVLELSKDNNFLASPPLTVLPAYNATIVADLHAALANTPIPMHGQATLGGGGTPAAFVPITIHVQVRGTDRTFTVLTAADGTFTNVFYPLPNEAGVYQLSAALPGVVNPPAQDTFVLIGMSVAALPLVDLTEGTSVTNSTLVNNLSDVPLNGLTVAVVTNQANLVVTATLSTNSLAAFATATLTVTVQALDASIFQSPVALHLASTEGATADLAFPVRVEALRPRLVLSPASLQGAMQRGTQTPVAFTVVNQGGVPTGPLQVVPPNVPWLSLASASQLPPLLPGSNTVITILLTPAADLPLGDYNGTLVVQSTNAAIQVPFAFRAVSDAKGNMLVTAEDEYTYFVAGAPRVTNALVVLTDALTGTPVVTNSTGPDGTVLFTNLTEAFYIVDVSAGQHSPFRQTALVPAGVTTNVVAFLSRQTVTYDFTVTPTTVADQYTFTINSTFETQVPIPVVTLEPASLDLSQYPGNEFQVLYTVANHGLIDAEQVLLNFPSASWIQITALVTNLGKLPANTSFTIPVLFKRLTATNPPVALAAGARAPKDAGSGTCSVTPQMLWNYLCGPNVVDKSTATYVFDSTGCDLPDLYFQVYNLVPNAGTGGGGGGGGGGGITTQQYEDYLDQFNPVTDFGPPPGYHFECKKNPPPLAATQTSVHSKGSRQPKGGSSVCAQVKITLDQRGVLTRDAFNAMLTINNDVTNALQNLQASLQVTDLTGALVSSNFAIAPPTLSGLTAVDGTGTLPGGTVGTANWTIIPTLDAAPTTGMTVYLVGGMLSYTQDGAPVSVPLAPAPIQVFPQPELVVRYFHDRNVYGDDPFTPQIEPSIPYSLAVQVNNVGHGTAQSLDITSGKPQIVDNVKGLLIDFTILGTQLENQPVTPSLSVDFGSIAPGTNKIARWLFLSPLQGSFTNFSASFAEVNSFGKPQLSLIRSVELHELAHIVDAGPPFEDFRPDFLVVDTPNSAHLPDTLYLSDGSIMPVAAFTNSTILGALASTNLSLTVTNPPAAGWTYFRFGDPGPGQYQLAHVFRADHSEIPFGTNAWTTDRIFLGGDKVPTLTNQVHLLDYNSAGSYTLVYAPVVTNGLDTTPPTSAVAALPASSKPTFTVQWSGADNPGGSGLAYFSIYVSTNGGPFGPWLTNTTLTAALFSGAPNTTYAFYSRATDAAGNQEAAHVTADAQTATAIPNNAPPVITPIPTQTVTEGTIFSFTPTATDADLPAETLTWSLLPGAPPGALIASSSGHVTWQTTLGAGGTTNAFSLVVTDNGSPSLSATQAFNVVVLRVNHPPSIKPPPPLVTVNEQTLLSLALSATDPDLPQQTLTWQLGPGAPVGLSLDPVSGLLTWTPTHAQAPSTNVVTVIVRDNGVPSLSDTTRLVIVVNPVNQPPVLATIANQTAFVLMPLTVTNAASDPNVPAPTLTFSLDAGAPDGATIDPATGVFTWTPARSQAASTNLITVRVTDNGQPPLSDAQTFTVVVADYLEVMLGSNIVQTGETGSVAIAMSVSTPVTNVNFTLDILPPGLTNFALAAPAPPLASAKLQQTAPAQFQVSLAAAPGQTLTNSPTLSLLNFRALAGASSSFVLLRVSAVTADQPDGVPLGRTLADDGRVVVVGTAPLLEAVNGAPFQLVLFAPPGPSYTVRGTMTLTPPLDWAPIWNGPVGSNLFQVIPVPATNTSSFFQATAP